MYYIIALPFVLVALVEIASAIVNWYYKQKGEW